MLALENPNVLFLERSTMYTWALDFMCPVDRSTGYSALSSRPSSSIYHFTHEYSCQGYLSFWNDNISYALRGCILIELALRRRIALVKDPNRRRSPLSERLVEVIDDRQTGETILDETLRMMKGQQETEKIAINSWIDLLSGESIGFLPGLCMSRAVAVMSSSQPSYTNSSSDSLSR